MVNVEEISKFKTSDGIEFDNEEEAMTHAVELVTKDIQPNDLIVKDRFGREIELKDLWWRADAAFYVEAHSEAALNFFNEASYNQCLLLLEQGLGIYRYDEYSDCWVTPQEEVQKLCEQWAPYNEELKFTIS